MNNIKLKSTHQRLTFLFTGLVFCIVCILGFSTLSAKYFNEIRIQKAEFKKGAQEIEKILEGNNIVLQTLLLNRNQQKRKFGDMQGDGPGPEGKPFLSFVLLDENNDIVFENVLERVDFGTLRLPEDAGIYKHAGILYQALDIDSQLARKLLVFSKIRYDRDDFLRDIGILLAMIGIFSALFYFLGYRFVQRALKPVEENLQDMSDFIHNAGHELKTPLAVMRGNLQIMQVEGKLDEELLKKSILQVDHINLLIESLRELSEIGSLSEKQKCNLKDVLSGVCEGFQNYAGEKEILLENNVHKNFYIEANPQELMVLLGNIIKNALKYTPAGGKVDISLSKNILQIRDTGIGIAGEDQEKIFDRFYQTEQVRSKEGFGIGLSLVKKIADANNWNIEVKSELGKGTSFYIVF